MSASRSREPDELWEPQVHECLERNNNDESKTLNALCVALMEAKMAGNEREAGVMLKSRQLLQAHNYSVVTAVGARKIWKTSMILSDTSAGTIFIREEFIKTAWASLKQTVRVSRLRSTWNNSMEVRGFISLPLQIGHLQKKVELIVVQGLATNMLLRTTVSSFYTKRNLPK